MTRVDPSLPVAALFALLASACVPTETGSPPALLVPTHISGDVNTSIVEMPFTITGAAGAVSPGEGEVLLLYLDDATEPRRAEVASDGSFEFEDLPPLGSGRVRLWVEQDAGRSDPLDYTLAEAGIVLEDSSFPTCVSVTPRYFVDFGDVPAGMPVETSVTVRNNCSSETTLGSSLRGGATAFAIDGLTLLRLSSGDSESLSITVTPTDAPGQVLDALNIRTNEGDAYSLVLTATVQ